MKKLIMLYALFAVLVAPVVGAEKKGEDEAIHKRHDEWCAAWNKHDPKAMAAFFTADGDLINPFGTQAKGTAEIEKVFSDEQSGPMANSTYSGTIQNIRHIGKDVAIVDVDGVITGMKSPDGSAAPPFKHHVTWIAQMHDGKWLALGARAFITLPSPKPADKSASSPTK